MNKKHTPGPWRFEVVETAKDEFSGLILTETRETVAEVFAYGDTRTAFGQGDPNASLIAAAPELLSMLKHVTKHLVPDSYGLRAEIEALIAKAEGRGDA